MVMKNYLGVYKDIKLKCVKNGLEAVQLMDCDHPLFDIILMDCNMPVMDGYQTTQQIRTINIRRRQNRLPIIAVTANVLHSDLDNCILSGMDDYLTKPFRREKIRKKIDQYVNKQL